MQLRCWSRTQPNQEPNARQKVHQQRGRLQRKTNASQNRFVCASEPAQSYPHQTCRTESHNRVLAYEESLATRHCWWHEATARNSKWEKVHIMHDITCSRIKFIWTRFAGGALQRCVNWFVVVQLWFHLKVRLDNLSASAITLRWKSWLSINLTKF